MPAKLTPTLTFAWLLGGLLGPSSNAARAEQIAPAPSAKPAPAGSLHSPTPAAVQLGKHGIRPQVASNDAGEAIVVWRERADDRYLVRAKLFDPSTGWSKTADINLAQAKFATFTGVAMDASGNAMAVWSAGEGTTKGARREQEVWAARFVSGKGWEAPVIIGARSSGYYPGGHGTYPTVAMSPRGCAVVVWQRRVGDRYDVWANSFTPARSWGTAASIESNPGDAVRPQVAVSLDGTAVAVWQQFAKESSYSRPSHSDVWANHFTFGKGWSTAAPIETDNAGRAQPPAVAISAKGVATVAWVARGTVDSHDHVVWANRYLPQQGWGVAQMIQTERGEEGWGNSVRVASTGEGDAIAVWEQTYRTTSVWTRAYVASKGWQAAVKSSTPAAAGLFSAQLVSNATHAVRAWVARDKTVWLAERDAQSGWKKPRRLAAAKKTMLTPAANLTLDQAGNLTVAWQHTDGAWVQRLKTGTK